MFAAAADVVIAVVTKNQLILTPAECARDRLYVLIAREQVEFTDKEILFFNL